VLKIMKLISLLLKFGNLNDEITSLLMKFNNLDDNDKFYNKI